MRGRRSKSSNMKGERQRGEIDERHSEKRHARIGGEEETRIKIDGER
jgi:hypothetical protein